jgi:hypothetical protein
MDYPKINSSYLRSSDFQDNPTTLHFVKCEYVSNEDDAPDSNKKTKLSWKDKRKFVVGKSFNQFKINDMGEQELDEQGNPEKNPWYLPEYPRGYTIRYTFEEGVLESGATPLWREFCKKRPKEGDVLLIGKTGVMAETRWSVKILGKGNEMPEHDVDEFGADTKLPF